MKVLVSFDLDGTLVDNNNSIYGGKETIKLLEELKKRDVDLMISTGRLDHDIYFIDEKYNLNIESRISQNGAVVYKNNNVTAKVLDRHVGKKIYELIKGFDVRIELNTISNRYWLSDRDPDFPKEFYDSSIIVDDYSKILEFQPVVLFLIVGESSKLEEIREIVNANFSENVDTVKTSNTSLEILSKGINKGNTVKNEYPNHKIIAIGDSENDYSMFSISDVSYYVGKSVPPEGVIQMENIYWCLLDILKNLEG